MKRIVIVDDEFVVIEGLRQLIDWTEYDAQVVGCAQNGAEGLELILKERPDIVFTDIKMPAMNGLTMIDKAKQMGCECIFVIFSGYNEFTYAHEALSLGVISYIEKPVTIEQINAAMKKACRIYDSKNHDAPRSESETVFETSSIPDEWSSIKSPFVKLLLANASKIRLSIQKGNDEQLQKHLEEHFRILDESNASSPVIMHEGVRLIYIALSELGDDENDFILEIMHGNPPFVEASKIIGRKNLWPWVTQRLLDVVRWIQRKNSSQMHISVMQAKEYLDMHFTESISLHQLADVVHINAAYLSTLFKKEMGISYVKYLTDLRLSEARKRLLSGERVGVVCREVGFKDGRHFAKLYKEKYGVTPDKARSRKE
ncbi:MAG: response regulator [Clostridiales bacterium]|nr:response regulator [Clostridiales bacterium]